jgi:hypothetical protein
VPLEIKLNYKQKIWRKNEFTLGPTAKATLVKLKFGSKMEKFINSTTSYSLRFCLSEF